MKVSMWVCDAKSGAVQTLLQLIGDDAYTRGAERLHSAARTATGPLVDVLDLLVLR
jgi:hypothetical protein